jgi:hydroxyacylglutathione hydrolase
MSSRNETTRFSRNGIDLFAVPVREDNFVYLVCRNSRALLIDAGEAAPVRLVLDEQQLKLTDILLTHGHADHTAGVTELEPFLCKSAPEPPAYKTLSVPGHTTGDRAFYFPGARAVFTGDCLINGACGRVFSGTAALLFESLQKIKRLPDDTLVFGGHDYLKDNLRFALAVEPGNAAVQARLDLYRTDPSAALFVTLAEEKESNPFLRVETADAFAELRTAKDRGRGGSGRPPAGVLR